MAVLAEDQRTNNVLKTLFYFPTAFTSEMIWVNIMPKGNKYCTARRKAERRNDYRRPLENAS
jgi:hypothetical protein